MLICPRITKEQLLSQCRGLGIVANDLLMVHASMRAVGAILGGPDMLIEALKDSVGAAGAIMSYLGAESPYDDIGRGILTEDEELFIMENLSAFDPTQARANRDHGIFAEFFRTHKDVVCSRNPGWRMAAWGAHAQWLTEGHSYDFGSSEGSPLERFCQRNGKILLIGSDLDNVSMLHYAEALAKVEDKRTVQIKVPLLVAGKTEWRDVVELDSSSGIKLWDNDFFSQIIKAFLDSGQGRRGLIGNAESYLLDANGLVNFAIPVMEETALNLSEES